MSGDLEDINDDTVLTMSVPAAGAIVGLTRNKSYDAANNGEIPTIRFGKLMRVPKAAWRRKLQEMGVL
jgi:excisionase family DNA binding protein